MIYIPSFTKIGSGIQKLIGVTNRYTESMVLFLQNRGSRLQIFAIKIRNVIIENR
jgi:hypothetical protein